MNADSKKYQDGVVLLSGGLDSAVTLDVASQECSKLWGLFFAYGQKTLGKEQECARKLAEYYRLCMLYEVDLGFVGKMTGAALCSTDVTVTGKSGNEYVPFRNGMFLAIGTALAESVRAQVMYIGSLGGDRICKDNSPAFRQDFEQVIISGTNAGKRIEVRAPLENLDKQGAVRRGLELGTPFELTWSCHNNMDTPCNVCSNCTARKAAFEAVNRTDPILNE